MPASTIYDLYKFETHIISASKAMLGEVGINAAYAQQDNTDLPTPRVDIQSVVGSPTGHVYISGSNVYYDSWNATLNAVVVTERTNNPSSHYDYTSKVISVLSNPQKFNSGSLLPYHTVARADFQGSTPSIESEDNRDLSAVTFVLSVWIKQDAWPS